MDHVIIGVVDLGWRMALHSLVGPVPLTLAIVAAYGLLIKGVRAQAIGRDTTGAIFHAVFGLLTIPVLILLVFLWSVAIDVSFPSGLFVWSAILASGHGRANFATKWQHGRVDVADSMRVPVCCGQRSSVA